MDKRDSLLLRLCPEPKCGGELLPLGSIIGGTRLWGCQNCLKVFWEPLGREIKADKKIKKGE